MTGVGYWALGIGDPRGSNDQLFRSGVIALFRRAMDRGLRIEGRGMRTDLVQTDGGKTGDGNRSVDISLLGYFDNPTVNSNQASTILEPGTWNAGTWNECRGLELGSGPWVLAIPVVRMISYFVQALFCYFEGLWTEDRGPRDEDRSCPD